MTSNLAQKLDDMSLDSFDGDDDILQDECGVFGCLAFGDWPTKMDVSNTLLCGLVCLQHRGQESAGMVTSFGGDNFASHKGQGLVSEAFRNVDLLKLKGNLGIAHTRYSTFGGGDLNNVQPFVVHTAYGPIAVAHNGELVNAKQLRENMLRKIGLSTGTDSEILTQILCQPLEEERDDEPNWPGRIKRLMKMTPLSYSILLMFKDVIYAARDPFGNRPLCVGEIEDTQNRGLAVSSESCAFSPISAKLVREVEPGEILRLSRAGIERVGLVKRPHSKLPALCIFEYVYFSRPDSKMEGQMVYTVREECGRQLAREAPLEVDLVSCVPESSTPAALGFSKESHTRYVDVLCKNGYIGRTFIQPKQELRAKSVTKKFGALTGNIKGKRIVLIDDSIVRGTTIKAIISLLKENGAKEVHIRIASPPLYYPCYMGINIPTKTELIANKMSCEDLCKAIGATSLVYLSIEGLKKAVMKNIRSENAVGHCVACLTGNYPVDMDW